MALTHTTPSISVVPRCALTGVVYTCPRMALSCHVTCVAPVIARIHWGGVWVPCVGREENKKQNHNLAVVKTMALEEGDWRVLGADCILVCVWGPTWQPDELFISKARVESRCCSFKFQSGFLLPTLQTTNLFLPTVGLCPGNKNIQHMASFYLKMLLLYHLMRFSGWFCEVGY